MLKLENKTKITTITLILTLTLTATLIPATFAQKTPTFAFVAASPSTVGLGQNVVISMWMTPPPPWSGDWAEDPIPFEDYMITITKPDATTDTYGPFTSYGSGSAWFSYIPDQLGTFTVKFSWAGDDAHQAAESQPVTFVVQQEPIPPYPGADLPTEYWERPISSENREWYQISGNWLSSSWSSPYNASEGAYNPYSKGPNTAHIVWREQVGLAGLIGGEYGSQAANRLEGQPVHEVYPIIMLGRVYYIYVGMIHCLDLSTGQELWAVPGSGELYGQPGPNPTLWTIGGGNYVNYDAHSGAELSRISDSPAWAGGGTFVIEEAALQLLGSTTAGAYIYIANYRINITKYDLSARAETWEDRIVWSTDWPEPSLKLGGSMVWGDVLCTGSNIYPGDSIMALNTKTGAIMWNNTYTFSTPGYESMGYGKYYAACSDLKWRAWDLYTGNIVWESDPMDYPWGDFGSYNNGVAYGKLYALSYDGHVYAYDAETGDLEWKFFSGETGETGVGQWAFWTQPVIADGKIYATTGLHSTGGTIPRGDRLYCIDAYNGDLLWSISHTVIADSGAKGIADGKLITVNAYDGMMYAFDKGKTATTVTASPKIIADGSSVLIEGTVMDQSPASPDTPAISDEDMSAWMEYLHMQKPIPGEATGVEVSLDTIDPNGNWIHIDTVTSDISGLYSYMWEPEHEGKYTIIATFEGSDSYWASYAETAIGVTEAPSPAQSIEPNTLQPMSNQPTGETSFITTEITIIAAVAVAIVIGTVSLYVLRKQRK